MRYLHVSADFSNDNQHHIEHRWRCIDFAHNHIDSRGGTVWKHQFERRCFIDHGACGMGQVRLK